MTRHPHRPPTLALAPMQNVTDFAFMRTLLRIRCLPDIFVTPYFRSTSTACIGSDQLMRCIRCNPTNRPVWAQLAGCDTRTLLRDAKRFLSLPIAGINLNVGCPAPMVNKHGVGAALLKNPAHLRDICCSLRELLPPGRWSIKCRIGWESEDEFPAVLEAICAAEPDILFVHARTRSALYSGKVSRAAVRLAVKRAPCPVYANGDINTPACAAEWLRTTGADGLMPGRGVVRNPYLLREIRGGAPATHEEMLLYYNTLFDEVGSNLPHYTPSSHCARMKKYLAYCYADMTHEQEYALRRCTDPAVMQHLLTEPAAALPPPEHGA